MPILQKEDFANNVNYLIPQDSYTELASYFTKFEEKYLLLLLGADLYTLFKANLSGTPEVPADADYVLFFNKFFYNDNNQLYQSEGIKQMLIQLVYFHYMLDQVYQDTKSGTGLVDSENSTNEKFNPNWVDSYNEGVKNFKAIQCYIEKYIPTKSKYEPYMRSELDYTSGI